MGFKRDISRWGRKGDIPTNRWNTYRSYEKLRRAYYRFICNEGLYNPARLKWPIGEFAREPLFNPWGSCTYFMHGYPLWKSGRSEAVRQFLAQGEEKLDAIHAESYAEACRLREERWERQRAAEKEHEIDLRQVQEATGVYAYEAIEALENRLPRPISFPRDMIAAMQFHLAIKRHLKNTKCKTSKNSARR